MMVNANRDNMGIPRYQKGSIPCGIQKTTTMEQMKHLSHQNIKVKPLLPLKDDWLMLSAEKCTK